MTPIPPLVIIMRLSSRKTPTNGVGNVIQTTQGHIVGVETAVQIGTRGGLVAHDGLSEQKINIGSTTIIVEISTFLEQRLRDAK